MSSLRLVYRYRQFHAALFAKAASEDLRQVEKWLSPQEMALFARLQPSEQAHSIDVFRSIQSREDHLAQEPDLLVAALLHDVGKCSYPLRLWERVWIVLAQALFPGFVERWGRSGSLENTMDRKKKRVTWWQRPFVIAINHPEWGAELAAEADASPMVIALIRRHQNLLVVEGVSLEDRMLFALQHVDGAN